METYKPIACGSYDVLEIICMDSYDVEVLTDTGSFTGEANSIEKKGEAEYLIVKVSESELLPIRADSIHKINVLTRPCRFSTYDFR